jgi:hypothetical protein
MVLALATLSCSEDKGSYDYKEINEVVISGLNAEYIVVYQVDTLKISPRLHFSQDSTSEDRYEYVWEAGSTKFTSVAPTAVIGRERNLNYFVELEPGDYTLYLGVIDKETGVRWTSTSRILLHVRTPLVRGFLLIGEDEEGYTDVNMIAMPQDTIVFKELLKNKGLPPLRNPQKISFTAEYSTTTYDHFVELWVMTGDGSYYLDVNTLEGNPANHFQKMLFTVFPFPADMKAAFLFAKRNEAMLLSRFMICDNGYLFRFSLSQGGYGDPLRLGTDPQTVFSVFPYAFTGLWGNEFSVGNMFYDMDNNRFVFNNYSNTLYELVDTETDIFQWKQPPGRVIVYGENSPNTGNAYQGSSYALMKDESGKYYIYRFAVGGANASANTTSPTKIGNFTIDLPRLPEAKVFAFSSTRTLMFYAVEKTLYAYDYSAQVLYQRELPDEITMLEFDIYTNGVYRDLYVATYNPVTKGRLQKYVVGTDPNTLDLIPDERCNWDGLVKIVDMEWRNSTRTYPPHP